MLVIISDLHLKDGTSGTTITADAFRIFAEWLCDTAFRASWRADGKYRPVEQIDLVLLGDVFDQIRSARWLQEDDGEPVDVRPWSDPQSEAFIRKIRSINTATLEHNAQAFKILKRIGQGQLVTLPPASRAGVPDDRTSTRLSVNVRIFYMVGNHDWFFYLPGGAYDSMRQEVIDHLGLVNSTRPFPHDPFENPELAETLDRHKVFARHGDIFDAMNYDSERGRNAATLGDALAVELLDRFPFDVRQRLGDELPQAFSEGLKELANVRPALVTPMWIGDLIDKYAKTPQQVKAIQNVWIDLVERFLDLDFVRSHDRRFALDIVDAMEGILRLSRGFHFDAINRVMGWAKDKFWRGKISYAQYALEEAAFLNRTSNYIVYGHTHCYEVVPLEVRRQGDKFIEQVYVNSGTWHSFHDLVLGNPAKPKFIGHHVMSYLAFFKDDERSGRSFESWSGSLSKDLSKYNFRV